MRQSGSASRDRDSGGPTLRATELAVHIRFEGKSKSKGSAGTAARARVAHSLASAVNGPEPEPTDVIVYDGKPWHYAGLPGQSKQLRPHPRVHKEYRNTVLVVVGEKKESVVWWSETAFSNVTIAPSKHPNRFFPEADTAVPRNPFRKRLKVRKENRNRRTIYVVRSSVPIAAALGHMYKIEFRMGGRRIDPDMYCGAP